MSLSPASGRYRVLHVGKYYPPAPGGMERVVQMLCEGERAVVDSEVLVVNRAAATLRETCRGVPVVRVGSLASIGSVGVSPTFPWHLHRIPRELTVLHEPNPLALVSDAVTAQRGPLVVWFHSEVLRPEWKYRLLYRPFLRRVLDRASRIIVASPPVAEHAIELQDYRHKCCVVPYGIDTARLAPEPRIHDQAAGVHSRIGRPFALFVGRLVPYKGVDVLIRAVRDTPGLAAVIVGDGPLRSPLERLARELGVGERVRFPGPLPDRELLAYYHACDMFVLPSVTRAEAFGMVQIEAMACGRPVVSTALTGSGVPWVNQHERTGLIVPPGDPAMLAVALTRLLDDPSLRDRLGRGGLARVAAEFTVPRMVARTTAIYGDILREARAA